MIFLLPGRNSASQFGDLRIPLLLEKAGYHPGFIAAVTVDDNTAVAGNVIQVLVKLFLVPRSNLVFWKRVCFSSPRLQ